MIGRFTGVVCALIAPLLLSGCIIGDGIAHVVKLTQESHDGTDASASESLAPAEAAAPRDAAPPPPPAPAPARNSVSVETLAPPK